MRYFLICLLLVGVTAFGGCSANNSSTAPGGTAPQAAAPAQSSPAKSVAKIVAFGDSLTAGYGLSESESYPALLEKKLKADGYNYEVVNAGVSGDTSAGGLRRIDWALEGEVKLVILELGANDILRGQPIPAMRQNLAETIKRIQSKGATVLLAGMEAPTSSGVEYRKDVHEAYTSLAREYDVSYLPFLLDRVAGIESLNQKDGIHPNAEGARIVAENVYQALKPLLEKAPSGR